MPRSSKLTPAQRAALEAGARPAPPAPPGNRRAYRHGGWATIAPARVEAKVAEVAEALASDAPLRDGAGELPRHDALAVHELAEAVCRLEDVRAHLRDFGWIDQETGEPRGSVLAVEDRLAGRVARLMRELGMTPASRAALGVDLVRSIDLAQAWAAQTEQEENR